MKIITAFLFLCTASSAFAQLPKGNRILSYSLDVAQNLNYDSAFFYGNKACMEASQSGVTWSAIEQVPNQIGGAQFNSLDGFNSFYANHGMKVELGVPIINGTAKWLPPDLMSVPFSSPLMISRFKIFIDSVLHKIPDVDLTVLNIGNETNALFGTDTAAYADYKTFLDSVTPFVKQIYFSIHGTNLKVGTIFMWSALTNSATKNLCKSVNQGRDVVSITYYPLGAGFHQKNPNVVPADFGTLVAEYPDTAQPIYFSECGYSSNTACDGSLALQSQFIQKVFQAWDTYYSNIKCISLYKTTDWPQSIVDTVAVQLGMPNDTIFKAFMLGLGLRTYPGNGTNKPAYDTLLCQLGERGFCFTGCTTTGIAQTKENDYSVKIYPNPFSNQFTIALSNNEQTTASLYNFLGQQILQQTFTNSTTINTEQMQDGIYFYELRSNKGTLRTGKLVKQ